MQPSEIDNLFLDDVEQWLKIAEKRVKIEKDAISL